jgi:hypothetical protein
MKPPLTFLLSLTFLFMFSGSVYGGVIDDTFEDVFDRKDGVVVLSCNMGNHFSYIVLNRKNKVIKFYENNGEKYETFEIVKENEVFIRGEIEGRKSVLFITKHIYEKHVQIIWDRTETNPMITFVKKTNHKCSIGDKKF